jgi:hypothetical protein
VSEKFPPLTAFVLFAVQQGHNIVVRNSADSIVTIPEPRSFSELLSDVQKAIRGEEVFTYNKVRTRYFISNERDVMLKYAIIC